MENNDIFLELRIVKIWHKWNFKERYQNAEYDPLGTTEIFLKMMLIDTWVGSIGS